MIFFLLYVRLFRIFQEPKVTTNQLTTCRLSKRHFYHVFLVNMFLTNKMAWQSILMILWLLRIFFLPYHFRELSEEILHFLHSYFICVKSANSGNCNRICKCNVRRRDTKKTCVGVAIFVLSTTFPNFELFGKCSHERTKQRTKKVVSALQQQSSWLKLILLVYLTKSHNSFSSNYILIKGKNEHLNE